MRLVYKSLTKLSSPLLTPIVKFQTFPQISLLKQSFSSSQIHYKKANKSKNNKNNQNFEDEDVIEFDSNSFLRNLESKYKESFENYKKKTQENKSGKANSNIFDKLKIPLSHNETVNFTDIAQTTLKGRNLLITLFDPKDSKHVISAVIGSGLNLNPQIDSKNPQLLKVPLPVPTGDAKLQVLKDLKTIHDLFKSSSSRFAFTTIRSEAMKELKKLGKNNDNVKKIIKQVEDLNKDYNKKLNDQLKEFEKTIMQ